MMIIKFSLSFCVLICFSCLNIYAQNILISTITQEFNGSGGLSLDDTGNLYIGDFGDFLSANDLDGLPNNVWKLDPGGNLSTYSSGFSGASGNDFNSQGILYQSDIGTSEIYKIVNGQKIFVTSTGISAPVGLVFDGNDNFFVCNCGNNTIRKVTQTGISTLFASGTIFKCPNGLTIDEDDNLYVSNFSNGDIIKITPDGSATVINSTPGGSTSGPSNGHLDFHQPTRTLFIASHGANKIFRLNIDTPENLEFVAGSGVRGNADGDATTASFSRPNGVAVTSTGDSIYINSAIPLTNIPNSPLNPQVIRLITGIQAGTVSVSTLQGSITEHQIYPNPTQEQLTFQSALFGSYTKLKVRIHDITGKFMFEKTQNVLNDSTLVVDLSSLPSGQYSYSIYSEGNLLLSGTILKI